MAEGLILRDSGARLGEKIFESASLDDVVQEAIRRGLTFDELQTDRITTGEPWVSIEESTVPVAVLYLKSEDDYAHLITKRKKEDNYTLFRYRWIP